jgi:hypothetical protein
VNVVPTSHKWEFQARFRRHAFGWRSQPAILRIKQAVSEIKKAVRRDAVLAADGAVLLLERISPALENVDGSSGAIGTAVNNAIAQLVPIIAEAPADTRTRERWLERLWEAYEAEQIPYIEQLGDNWGELCASKELAAGVGRAAPPAEQLVVDLARLRKDDALFSDILGTRGHRTPITAVVANMADPRDAGRKKAVARVRRTIRSQAK